MISTQKKSALIQRFKKSLKEMRLSDGTPIVKMKYGLGGRYGDKATVCALGVLALEAELMGLVPERSYLNYVPSKLIPSKYLHIKWLEVINDTENSPHDNFSWELQYLEENGPWSDFIKRKKKECSGE